MYRRDPRDPIAGDSITDAPGPHGSIADAPSADVTVRTAHDGDGFGPRR